MSVFADFGGGLTGGHKQPNGYTFPRRASPGAQGLRPAIPGNPPVKRPNSRMVFKNWSGLDTRLGGCGGMGLDVIYVRPDALGHFTGPILFQNVFTVFTCCRKFSLVKKT